MGTGASPVGYTYGAVRRGYPVALAPQQEGLTGEILTQRLGWSGFIEPQYPARFGTMFNGYIDPSGSALGSRASRLGYGLATGTQRTNPLPPTGTGPTTLAPGLNAYYQQVLAGNPGRAAATKTVWQMNTPAARG